MRDGQSPLLQAAIAIGAAIIVATVYLRHLLPVSGISFFSTRRQSKPVQARIAWSLGLQAMPLCKRTWLAIFKYLQKTFELG